MPAYVITDVEVHDPDTFREYAVLVPPTLEAFGGRYLVRGAGHESLEGEWQPKRLVVLEFPSAEQARGWYNSDGYVTARAIRQRASTGSMVLVEGTA